MMLTLSTRQTRAADRGSGIEIVLPLPAGLSPASSPPEATAAAEAVMAGSVHGLDVLGARVVVAAPPPGLAPDLLPRPWLVAHLRHPRWRRHRHPSGSPVPLSWSAAATAPADDAPAPVRRGTRGPAPKPAAIPPALYTRAGLALYGEAYPAPLARDLGISRAQGWSYIRGEYPVPLAVAERLADLAEERADALDDVADEIDAALASPRQTAA